MKKTTVRCHLMDILAEVPDPRKEKGKRHPLPAILALGIVATLSGAKVVFTFEKCCNFIEILVSSLYGNSKYS